MEQGYARNGDGVLIQAIPGMSIHAEINGRWESKEALRADLISCLDSLIETFDANALCGNQ